MRKYDKTREQKMFSSEIICSISMYWIGVIMVMIRVSFQNTSIHSRKGKFPQDLHQFIEGKVIIIGLPAAHSICLASDLI